ncbi:hypothetical protein HDV00_008571 [Rhizophlyctis rosea]|nr:hypothetical protein HDV00_008571 [Rhizophlyctis rosea]
MVREREVNGLRKKIGSIEKQQKYAKDLATERRIEYLREKEARELMNVLYENNLRKLETELKHREEYILKLEAQVARYEASPSPPLDSDSSDASPDYHISYDSSQYDNLLGGWEDECDGGRGGKWEGEDGEGCLEGRTEDGEEEEEEDDDEDECDDTPFLERASEQVLQLLVSKATALSVTFDIEDLAAKYDAGTAECLTAVVAGIVMHICNTGAEDDVVSIGKIVDDYAKVINHFRCEDVCDEGTILNDLELACNKSSTTILSHINILKVFIEQGVLEPSLVITWWRDACLRSEAKVDGGRDKALAELVLRAKQFVEVLEEESDSSSDAVGEEEDDSGVEWSEGDDEEDEEEEGDENDDGKNDELGSVGQTTEADEMTYPEHTQRKTRELRKSVSFDEEPTVNYISDCD